jgi:DNA polymerase-4
MAMDSSILVRWLYLDMNSFFASVEQEMNPRLRGKPIAVVPLLTDSTCCIAVSYEGKAFGVKTGTKVGDAKRLCPSMKFIEGDHGNYIKYHHRIIEAVESCIPVEAVCSIDEIACRLTGSQQNLDIAQPLAMKIKQAIRQQVGSSLCCSIGVAPNRYLAKIAADMNKPDGFTAIRPCDLPKILFPLKLRDLTGVGPRMELRLNSKKIYTMEKLLSLSDKELHRAWGSISGEEMFHLLRGKEIPQKVSDQKSISHSHVLPPELRNKQDASRIVKKLTAKTALRLRKDGFWATKLSIFVKFLGQDTWKASCGFMETQDTLVFLHAVDNLWKELPAGSIFSVGVVLFGLVPESLHALSLFDDPKRDKLVKALDKMNEKFGKEMVHFGATHETTGLAPLRIAFTRIPDESEI